MTNSRFPVGALGVESWLASSGPEHSWPTPFKDYLRLAQQSFAEMTKIWRSMNQADDTTKVLAVKLSNINHDLVRFGCLAIDLAWARETGFIADYDKTTNPVFSYLDNGGDPRSVAFARNDWPQYHRFDFGWRGKAVAKKALRWIEGIARGAEDRFDVISTNELLEQYSAVQGVPTRRLFAYLCHRPMPLVAPLEIEPLGEFLTDAFVRLFREIIEAEGELILRVREGARRISNGHLGLGWEDLKTIRKRGFANRPASIMASGTPKYLGRLLSLVHRECGGQVFRFAHGGERVFFDEPEWIGNELPFCDRYHCYGWGEAEAIERRLKEKRVQWIGDEIPSFVGVGAERHKGIYDQPGPRRTSHSDKTVVYVPGTSHGELMYMSPNVRCNDALYTEWQIFLLRSLRELGYRVTVKAHPSERRHQLEMFKKHCDKVDTGQFVPTRFNSRCLLFDFAGTAFFEALAADMGVVLLYTSVRPLDPTTLPDLDSRCVRILTHLDERNLFRVALDSLRSAIEESISGPGCSDTFFAKYYNAGP